MPKCISCRFKRTEWFKAEISSEKLLKYLSVKKLRKRFDNVKSKIQGKTVVLKTIR